MTASGSGTGASERRTAPREAFGGKVRIRIDSELTGKGQNISKSGVSLVLDHAVEVLVHIEGQDEPVRGELIRLTPMGDATGVAVRFLDG